MVTVTQTRREVTVRSARLDYVELDKRVAVLPTYDTTIPAVPTDTKAPSTKLFADQLALVSGGRFTDEATTGPFAGKTWQMYVYNGIPLLREVVALALLLTLSALAGDRESIVVDSVSRETAQEVHFTGTVLVPTPTSTSQAATKGYVDAATPTSISWSSITGTPTNLATTGMLASYSPTSHDHSGVYDPAGTAASLIASTALPRVRVLERNGLFLAIQSAITTNLIWQWGYETFWDQYETEAAVATKTGAYYDAANDLYSSLTPGTFDLTGSGTASAINQTEYASKPFDDNPSTYWYGYLSQWVQYNFCYGSAYIITGYGINQKYVGSTRQMTAWIIKGSNDGTNWEVISQQSGVVDGWTSGVLRTFAVPAGTVSYNMIRLYVLTTTNGGEAGLNEIEYYSSTTNNVNITSTMQETVDVPTSGTLMLIIDPIDAITMGTDIKTYLTRDGGNTWCEVALTKADSIAPLVGYETWIGDVELTGGSGSGAMSAGYKIQSFGETPKAFNIKAIAFQVRP